MLTCSDSKVIYFIKMKWFEMMLQRRESTAAFSIAAVIADEDYFLDGKITAVVYICVV